MSDDRLTAEQVAEWERERAAYECALRDPTRCTHSVGRTGLRCALRWAHWGPCSLNPPGPDKRRLEADLRLIARHALFYVIDALDSSSYRSRFYPDVPEPLWERVAAMMAEMTQHPDLAEFDQARGRVADA